MPIAEPIDGLAEVLVDLDPVIAAQYDGEPFVIAHRLSMPPRRYVVTTPDGATSNVSIRTTSVAFGPLP